MTRIDVFKARLDEIQRLADALNRHRTDLMEAAAYDAGFPVKITSIEVDLSADHLRTMDKEIPWVENGRSYGTVATIFPYDAPTVVLARLGGAALLTGNTLRFSLSSQTPRSASVLAEICKHFESIEPVVGMDNREFGRRCVADKDIRLFFISGASAVGEVYRKQHKSFDKLFFAGPGGMPAAIVFEDADATAAASFIARRAFINGGQYCTTLKKAYIHTSLYEEVRKEILDMVQRLKVGDAFEPKTDIGPIRVERTRNILQNALEKCRPARLLTGSISGETVFPLVLETENIDIPDLELFGPFLLIIPFDDPDESAMELVKTRYGFLLSFFGSPAEKIKTLFYSHFGMVHDNPDFTFTPLRLPFGGKKASGWILERKGNDWIERDGAFIYSKELAT
ncbi:MAG: aldehyde dehydrogenase family protein [Thermodesulfobacteriota bacterium]|nr:aldehyde dehydrogenase family protein [Thermodesulfobacteriota bacterium]